MDATAKALLIAGACLIVFGLAWQFGWIQALRIGRLPGDILIERENLRVYFPLTTGILLSLIASVVMWLLNRS